MRRDDNVLGVPQRAVRGEGFRVRDVETRAAQEAGVQRGDEGGLVEDRAARDVQEQAPFVLGGWGGRVGEGRGGGEGGG